MRKLSPTSRFVTQRPMRRDVDDLPPHRGPVRCDKITAGSRVIYEGEDDHCQVRHKESQHAKPRFVGGTRFQKKRRMKFGNSRSYVLYYLVMLRRKSGKRTYLGTLYQHRGPFPNFPSLSHPFLEGPALAMWSYGRCMSHEQMSQYKRRGQPK